MMRKPADYGPALPSFEGSISQNLPSKVSAFIGLRTLCATFIDNVYAEVSAARNR